ncbi:MAG: sigma-70 family RNA polymerase sigma factor [Minisyncoccia bacterium]
MDQIALEKIFAESFEAYSDAIFRFCMVKVSNIELAEDFTQEVFTRYWQTLRKGTEMTNTRAYLYTIAHNMAKDWYKKKKSIPLETHLETGLDPSTYTIATSEQQSEFNGVLTSISDMEEDDKIVLLLRYVDGLEPKDIASILGESANTISVRLHRAITKLQKRLHV